jgi:uncharacterized protein
VCLRPGLGMGASGGTYLRCSQVLEASADHTEQVVRLLEAGGGTAGNLVTDAQIAAFAQSYRAVLHTADRDFLRFPDIRCHFPLD